MAETLSPSILPILLLARLRQSHQLRFVNMYRQYMRRRRRKRHHSGCGFACGIQALLPLISILVVAGLLISPKWNLEQKDFERFTRFNEFHKKGLDNYELLRQLFYTVVQTSFVQHVSADDLDEQGSNPRGKQSAHSDTSTEKKRKARSLDRATKSRKIVESAQVPDLFSMAKATKILDSMSDLNDETMFEAFEKLEKPEWRQVFITLNPKRRRGWIKNVK